MLKELFDDSGAGDAGGDVDDQGALGTEGALVLLHSGELERIEFDWTQLKTPTGVKR